MLPLVRWSYAIESDQAGPGAGERAITAVLRYRLPSDRADATGRRRLVLAPGISGGWAVVSDDAVGAELPWDLGDVRYARGTHSEVLSPVGPAGPTGVDADLPAQASAAAEAVTGVWGPDWRRTPVVVAVHGAAQLADLTGRSMAGVAGLVAISTPDRVYVDLLAYAALDPTGRSVLLTHEVTHVATAAGADPAHPQWLKEGFADYVGFLHSGIGASVAAASLLARVHRTGPPAGLPADADFAPGASQDTLADAYAGGWLMCVLIAETDGQAALVSVYRRSGASGPSAVSGASPQAALDEALRHVTGRSLAAWTAAWQQDLKRRAA